MSLPISAAQSAAFGFRSARFRKTIAMPPALVSYFPDSVSISDGVTSRSSLNFDTLFRQMAARCEASGFPNRME